MNIPATMFRSVKGQGTSDLEGLCRYVGASCDRPVVIETKLPAEVLVNWKNALYYFVAPGANGMDDADVDSVLANVAKQTSLQFKRAKRTVATWVWAKN